jgi:magnesium transporter
MTLRSLYNYVIKTITKKLKSELPPEKTTDFTKSISSILTPVLEEQSSPVDNSENLTATQPQSSPPGLSQTEVHDHAITYRERLGGYLHPRDMRRLVTPFSSSNEPELMIRRHVMLLNFDPLRAIVLRDRLLLLVPDGADSILINLEKNVRGGIVEMERDVFGDQSNGGGWITDHGTEDVVDELASAVDSVIEGIDELDKETFGRCTGDDGKEEVKDKKEEEVDDDLSYASQAELDSRGSNDYAVNEWDDIEGMNWVELPFELQCVDAVLSSVAKMLTDDSTSLRYRILAVMEQLRGGDSAGAAPGDHTQEKLRLLKDEVKEMESRVQGFVRALNNILDEEEDMALMNLSRLITHPERFIQPVSQDILNEESDEPELILEAHLQQALSEVNALELLKGQILNTEELVSLQMDTIRNRLLYINTVVSLASLSVAMASMIGSVFGMNLINHLEDDEDAFGKVVIGTLVGTVCFLVVFIWIISRTGLMPTNPRKAWYTR